MLLLLLLFGGGGGGGGVQRQTNFFCWAHLNRFRLKTERDSSLRYVALLNKRQDDG
jgi:hypothetical protein